MVAMPLDDEFVADASYEVNAVICASVIVGAHRFIWRD